MYSYAYFCAMISSNNTGQIPLKTINNFDYSNHSFKTHDYIKLYYAEAG